MKLSSLIKLHDYNKMQRRACETRGVSVELNGETILVSTERGDDRAALQTMFAAIAAGLRADGAIFVFADGAPRSVSNADMSAIILTALTHVQSAFEREAVVRSAIDAGTVTTTAAVRAAYISVTTPWEP